MNVACTLCRSRRHDTVNCPEDPTIYEIVLYFPTMSRVRIAVSEEENRNAGIFRRNLTDVRHFGDRDLRGNHIMGVNNSMRIEYGGTEEMVIALQDVIGDAETLIHVKPERINIGAKYSVLRSDLIEHTQRSPTGSSAMNAPKCHVNILLAVEDLFESMVTMEVNGQRYYLEWRVIREDGYLRQAVFVSTAYHYEWREHVVNRGVLPSWQAVFLPPRAPPALTRPPFLSVDEEVASGSAKSENATGRSSKTEPLTTTGTIADNNQDGDKIDTGEKFTQEFGQGRREPTESPKGDDSGNANTTWPQ